MNQFIAEAEKYAVMAHAGQQYGDRPYIVHPAAVAGVLRRFGFADENLLASAYLHDTLEDTATNYQDLLDTFGPEVAELVYAVTDELGRNRGERANRTLPKIAAAGPKAVALKLADRIANVEACLKDKDLNPEAQRKLRIYTIEHRVFRAVLRPASPPGVGGLILSKMWAHLDGMLQPAAAPNAVCVNCERTYRDHLDHDASVGHDRSTCGKPGDCPCDSFQAR